MEIKLSDGQLKEKLSAAAGLAKEGNLDDAIIILKEILAVRPSHEISLGMLASIYLQIGMHQQAISHFETLLDIYPNNPLARFQLGMARLSQGQPQAALDTWEPMRSLENEFMAHFHSALALIQLGRNAEAVDRLELARQRMPESHPLFPRLLELHDQLTGKI